MWYIYLLFYKRRLLEIKFYYLLLQIILLHVDHFWLLLLCFRRAKLWLVGKKLQLKRNKQELKASTSSCISICSVFRTISHFYTWRTYLSCVLSLASICISYLVLRNVHCLQLSMVWACTLPDEEVGIGMMVSGDVTTQTVAVDT